MLSAGTSLNQMSKLYGIHRNTIKLFIERKSLDTAENIKNVRKMFSAR